ncbi:unnamed protein product [Diabrotica balteata]|uniref:Uncharacterized protein n=1 Tax=Diabrotica balteata TaxID=107213 RepID=A0A9N9XEI6_DIABA|nr:unnamed protein product [Diabrotica balteata]
MNSHKSLSSFSWGADEESLLKLYRALIRSTLDYGSIIYMTSSSYLLKSLNTIQNTFLRLCLSAFKSSPAKSPAKKPSLHLRRQQLLLSYFARILANPINPVINVINPIEPPPANASDQSLTLPQILSPLLDSINLSNTTSIYTPKTAPWMHNLPIINTGLCRFDKTETPNSILRKSFQNILNLMEFYTPMRPKMKTVVALLWPH